MSITISYNGTDYTIPTMGESDDWGTRLNAYLVALGAGGSNAALTHVRATVTTAQILTGTPTTVVYDIEGYDTLSEYDATTGIFTASTDGYYSIAAQVVITGAPYVAGHTNSMSLYVNDAPFLISVTPAQASASYNLVSSLVTTIRLVPGDTVGVRISSNAAYATSTSAYANSLAIDRFR